VISVPYKVFESKGNPVGRGIIGGADIVLAAGTYPLETTGKSPKAIKGVLIQPGELTTAAF